MRGVNRVMLIGNLGKDPDVQFLEGNIAVAKFPLATTETLKTDRVNWFRKLNGIQLCYGVAWPNWLRNICTKAALFILKAGYEPEVGKIKMQTENLLPK